METVKDEEGNDKVVWDYSSPIVGPYTIRPPATPQNLFQVYSPKPDSKELMTIHADGRITVDESAAPTETAKLVLDAMQGMMQEMLRREYQRGYDDATEFQEGG